MNYILDYNQKLFLPGSETKFVEVHFSKGYGTLWALYKGELILEGKNRQQLITGIKCLNSELGEVEIILSKDPYTLNLIVNKIHRKENSLHPYKSVRRIANMTLFLAVAIAAGVIIDVIPIFNQFPNSYTWPPLLWLIMVIELILFCASFICYFLVRKKIMIGFYIIVGLYSSLIILAACIDLQSIFNGILIKIVIYSFIIRMFPLIVNIGKHLKFDKSREISNEIID